MLSEGVSWCAVLSFSASLLTSAAANMVTAKLIIKAWLC